MQLSPNVACVTSMDADHLDIYGTGDDLKDAFVAYVNRLEPGGKLFVRNGLPLEGITYGIEDDSDFCITDVKIKNGSYIFNIKTPDSVINGVKFNKPGRHNLLNGLVAFAMALEAGKSPDVVAAALGSFKGVERRFSYRIKQDNFVFIDDYAHHPTEINAVYDAVSEMHPNKNTVAVFQPHLFSRTKDFIDDFAASLSQFQSIILLDIYPAREEPIEGVTSEWLLSKINNPNKKICSKIDLINEIKRQAPEVLVAMGAGDIGQEIDKIKNAFVE